MYFGKFDPIANVHFMMEFDSFEQNTSCGHILQHVSLPWGEFKGNL